MENFKFVDLVGKRIVYDNFIPIEAKILEISTNKKYVKILWQSGLQDWKRIDPGSDRLPGGVCESLIVDVLPSYIIQKVKTK